MKCKVWGTVPVTHGTVTGLNETELREFDVATLNEFDRDKLSDRLNDVLLLDWLELDWLELEDDDEPQHGQFG